MTDILRLSNNTPIWPYSVAQFRADEPHLSISDNPHDAELDSYATLDPPIILCRVRLTPPPECDARTERTEHQPTLTENGWQQAWSIRPATAEELAAYDEAHRPAPDWATFKATALNSASLKGVVAQAYQVDLVVAGCLVPTLLRVEADGPDDFAACWALVARNGNATPELIAELVAVATACHLPAEFVEALNPS